MVQLSDINGERHGGDDKACHIAIRLRAMRIAVVEAIHRNLYVAIDQAAVKAKAVLSKKLSRWLRVHHRRERGVERLRGYSGDEGEAAAGATYRGSPPPRPSVLEVFS